MELKERLMEQESARFAITTFTTVRLTLLEAVEAAQPLSTIIY
jgi:hypothetical protein